MLAGGALHARLTQLLTQRILQLASLQLSARSVRQLTGCLGAQPRTAADARMHCAQRAGAAAPMQPLPRTHRRLTPSLARAAAAVSAPVPEFLPACQQPQSALAATGAPQLHQVGAVDSSAGRPAGVVDRGGRQTLHAHVAPNLPTNVTSTAAAQGQQRSSRPAAKLPKQLHPLHHALLTEVRSRRLLQKGETLLVPLHATSQQASSGCLS